MEPLCRWWWGVWGEAVDGGAADDQASLADLVMFSGGWRGAASSNTSSSSTQGRDTTPKFASDSLRRPPAPTSASSSSPSMSDDVDDWELRRVSTWLMECATRGCAVARALPVSGRESVESEPWIEESCVMVVALETLRRPGSRTSVPLTLTEDRWLRTELLPPMERDFLARKLRPVFAPKVPMVLHILTRFSGVSTRMKKMPTPRRALTLEGRYHR